MPGNGEFRLLVLADPHCAASDEEAASAPSARRCRLGAQLLVRAIHDAKARGGFDAVALPGDVLNEGSLPQSAQTLSAVAAELKAARGQAPLLVAPGNHDGPPEALLAALGTSAGGRKIGPYRFFTFADRYGQGDLCARDAADQQRFLDWAGRDTRPIIVLQHNPMNPVIQDAYPYMLTNRPQVTADYSAAGVLLSLSGHFHAGQALSQCGGVHYLTAPALAEEPFPYLLVRLRGRQVHVERRQLKNRWVAQASRLWRWVAQARRLCSGRACAH